MSHKESIVISVSLRKRSFEFEKAVASLSGVDGVVVLSTHCKVRGFGVEIVHTSSEVETVQVAQDADAAKLRMKNIEERGTRHRSAFRLCNNLERCVVFVVSQDGDARAVEKVGPNVVPWNNVDLLGYSL
jgi:DNA integrity scanning protein DisA with diadenylate cyclase activity